MGIPSRAFVGMVVFGLIASLALLPYTFLVLSGYEAPPDSPQDVYLGPPSDYTAGDKVALVLGSLFSVGVTVFAWRALLAGARRDRKRREDARLARERGTSRPSGADAKPHQASDDEAPPGYN